MDLFAAGRITRSIRLTATVCVAAVIAALSMGIVARAQAAPSIATAWGHNNEGQLGDGTTEGPEHCGGSVQPCSTSPIAVNELSGVKAVSAGKEHSLALLENGTVMAWGRNNEGQLGNATTERSAVPVAVSGLSGVTAIAAGANHGLALLSNGTVMAWGSNGFGQLGDGSTENRSVPVAVSGLSGVVAIAGGERHSLALLSNGTVMAWGSNVAGQLGNGGTENSSVPVAVSGLTGVTAVSAGSGQSLALLSGGTVKAWGNNAQGQLGNGTTTSSNVPVSVSGLTGVSAVSAGGSFSLALLGNGTVKAWGANSLGELGTGTTSGPQQCGEPPATFACSKTPVSVVRLSGVSAIDGGENHSLALLSTGSVMAWGANQDGQLGEGSSAGPEPCGFGTPCSASPVAVLTRGVDGGISAGGAHSLGFGPPPPPATNLPELGRCTALATPTGGYKNGYCLKPVPGKGKFDWLPGPGAKNKFTGIGSGTRLETAGGKLRIVCGAATFDGEYTGAKAATVNIVLIGCENANQQKCQTSPLQAAQIETTAALDGELGFITGGEKPVVGLDLKPAPPSSSLFTFECGQPPEHTVNGTVTGSVIAPIKKIDAMSEEFSLAYKALLGKQVPERFEGGFKDTLTTDLVSGMERAPEQTGLISSVSIENEERLEIKAK